MKKFQKSLLVLFFLLISSVSVFAQNADEKKSAKDEKSELEKQMDTLNYGLESDISDLIDSLAKQNDATLLDETLELFNQTRNENIRRKILYYFQVMKDDRLKDFCLEFLLDPYDESTDYVAQVMQYVTALEIKEAAPLILDILKSDNEQFFNMSLSAIGKLGGKEEAEYLVEYMKNEDIPLSQEQTLMKALGDLGVVETYDDLVEIAQDEEKNSYVRMYALEAASKMGKSEIVPILLDINKTADVNLRCAVVRSSANFIDEKNSDAKYIVLDGLKDNHQNVRLEAVKICREKKLSEAEKSLIFRAKNDQAANVKYECYYAISAIGKSDGAKFLNSLITDDKSGETARAKAIDAILEYKFSACYDSVKEVAQKSLAEDKYKNLRYAIGKSLAKSANPDFSDICIEYLEHKDVSTQGTGLDIYATNRYSNAKAIVEKIAENDSKENKNQKKAKLVLEKLSK